MKLKRSLVAVSLVVALAGFGAGCSSDDAVAPGTTGGAEIDFDAPFGGLEATDEPRAFGDPELEASSDQEAVYEDVTAADLQVLAWQENDQSLRYALTVSWGSAGTSGDLGGSTRGAEMEWTGRLEASDGALVVMRLIDFEKAEDRILNRGDRGVVEWESITHGSRDGFRAFFIVPAGVGPDVAVTFVSGDVERELQLADLADFHEEIPVGDEGHQISLRSFKILPNVDVKGWMAGIWENSGPEGEGIFAGRWLARVRDGRGIDFATVGHVRGQYGVSSEGEKVFFGKLIAFPSGEFLGFLQGTWQLNRENSHLVAGTLQGEWVHEDGRHLGNLRGTWTQEIDGAPGHFDGVWISGGQP